MVAKQALRWCLLYACHGPEGHLIDTCVMTKGYTALDIDPSAWITATGWLDLSAAQSLPLIMAQLV